MSQSVQIKSQNLPYISRVLRMTHLHTTDGQRIPLPYGDTEARAFVTSLDEVTQADYEEALRKEQEPKSGFHEKI